VIITKWVSVQVWSVCSEILVLSCLSFGILMLYNKCYHLSLKFLRFWYCFSILSTWILMTSEADVVVLIQYILHHSSFLLSQLSPHNRLAWLSLLLSYQLRRWNVSSECEAEECWTYLCLLGKCFSDQVSIMCSAHFEFAMPLMETSYFKFQIICLW
jgi:hypothetical protein